MSIFLLPSVVICVIPPCSLLSYSCLVPLFILSSLPSALLSVYSTRHSFALSKNNNLKISQNSKTTTFRKKGLFVFPRFLPSSTLSLQDTSQAG
ncbi:hypothetical protein F5H01DRAFT_332874 [Linnemannia elongata]|nr:hypothetical protein F5H01DRAFT_332874 [Linnemannia elongata]